MPKGHPEHLDLDQIVGLAAQVTGTPNHHFRYIQLPFSIQTPELLVGSNCSLRSEKNADVALQAEHHGIVVVTSATLSQGDVSAAIPSAMRKALGAAGRVEGAIMLAFCLRHYH